MASANDRDCEPSGDLVNRCRQGDASAWAVLYQRYGEGLYRHLCIMVGPGAEAEDALQQTLLEAYRKRESFAGRSRLSTWLHGIAVRVALNILRGRKRRKRALRRLVDDGGGGPAQVGSTPERQIESRQQLDSLEQHLAALTPEKRIAFLLYYVEQLDLQEVAQLMGSSPNTALVRIRRARTGVMSSMEGDRAISGARGPRRLAAVPLDHASSASQSRSKGRWS